MILDQNILMSYLNISSLTEGPELHSEEMWNAFKLVSRGCTPARQNGWRRKGWKSNSLTCQLTNERFWWSKISSMGRIDPGGSTDTMAWKSSKIQSGRKASILTLDQSARHPDSNDANEIQSEYGWWSYGRKKIYLFLPKIRLFPKKLVFKPYKENHNRRVQRSGLKAGGREPSIDDLWSIGVGGMLWAIVTTNIDDQHRRMPKAGSLGHADAIGPMWYADISGSTDWQIDRSTYWQSPNIQGHWHQW